MTFARVAVAALAVGTFLPASPQAIAGEGFDLVVLGALGGILMATAAPSPVTPALW
jgi:hypothetical protein